MALRNQATDKVIFSIANLIDKPKKKKHIYFEINNELSEFDMGSVSLDQEFDELVKVTLAEKRLISDGSDKENNPPDMTEESAKGPNFFQSNKLSQKKSERKYITTRIK